ncbi:MAG TPA: DUF4388 domain-containing protein, partial [Thermoanaerobaculia bacterium]|nr:DUF4388 domain-containing protein [Thermoanaerobaculia bacterium]
MSLLGRLEDLSLTDIIQIVFLSRRTGILEILNSRGRHTVLFHHGLVVNASSPDNPDLAAQLERETVIDAEGAGALREMEKGGGVVGDSLLESGVLTPGQLATLIQQRVQEIVSPLLANKEGEFNFLLSEGLGKSEIGYDSDSLFREGGIAPHMILGTESEKVKPLQGLEESMRVGKALLRGATPPSPEPMPPAGGLIPAATSVDAPESPQAPPAPRSELPFAEV